MTAFGSFSNNTGKRVLDLLEAGDLSVSVHVKKSSRARATVQCAVVRARGQDDGRIQLVDG